MDEIEGKHVVRTEHHFGEGLGIVATRDVAALEPYLKTHVEGFRGALRVRQFKGTPTRRNL